MSRSYKKVPISKDNQNCCKKDKQRANRKIRRTNKLSLYQNKEYSKITNTWDIHDYVSRWTKQEAIDYYNLHKEEEWFKKRYRSLEDYLLKVWYKYYRRK